MTMAPIRLRPIDEILGKRVLITCGTGGVGKTTLSAAMALRTALLGKKTVVITIDPAKRLATSLGLKSLGDEPTDLTPLVRQAWEKARDAGANVPPELTGTLHAIIPDTRRTFDSFVHEVATSPALEKRILANPLFQIFAKEFSGANEYMALQRLQTLERSGQWDCILLDTPPSRNTLDFLAAPKLLGAMFEEKLIRWLVVPANRLVASGMKKGVAILERLTGAGFMTNLVDFATALFDVQGNFTSKLNSMLALLESPDSGFMMVTMATPDTAPEVRHFIETLASHRFRFEGVALNRTLSYFSTDAGQSSGAYARAFEVLQGLQRRERRVLDQLEASDIRVCATVPELARDVHSIEDLLHVALALAPEARWK